MPNLLLDLRDRLDRDGILFCFSGPVSQGLLEGLAALVRERINQEDASTTVVRKVFSTFVEQVQNIIHHSTSDEDVSDGIVAIGVRDGRYYVFGGNRVPVTSIERIRQKVDPLQGMSPDELKKMYKEERRKDPIPGAKGAGLGFLEMARKASEPLEIDFEPIDDDYAFFSLKVVIG